MFPATAPILDPLDGPVGALSGNWIGGGEWGSGGLTIAAGGGATGTVTHVATGNAWRFFAATVRSAFVTVAVLPAGTDYAGVGAISNVDTADLQLAVSLTSSPAQMNLITPGGSASYGITPANGDSIGWTYDPGTGIATAYYRAAGTSAWVSKGTQAAGLPLAPSGWALYLEASDSVAVRLRNFGGELLPGALPGATVSAPQVHGRGAC